jgi:hypothetical protein
MNMSDFKVGDRVQWIDRDTDEVTGGTIESTIPPKRMKTNDYWRLPQSEQDEMITYANIKWDDNTSDSVDIDDLDPEDTQLEREFRLAAAPVLSEIQRKVTQASKLLSEAVKLSEEHGIPFNSDVSFLGQSYTPTSFSEKYPDLSSDLVYEITEASNEYGDAGWEHSDVC